MQWWCKGMLPALVDVQVVHAKGDRQIMRTLGKNPIAPRDIVSRCEMSATESLVFNRKF